jgi:hypothetical protein
VGCPLFGLINALPLDRSCILRNAEHALHATGDTSRNPADRPTHGPANRTSGPIANRCPLLSPTHNSLRLNRRRHGKSGKAERGD